MRSLSALKLSKPEKPVLEFILEKGHDLERAAFRFLGSVLASAKTSPVNHYHLQWDIHYLGNGHNST